jgi:hypothetical protein
MADPAKQKTSKREVWFKFGRFISGITIACFFLPFFGVSCAGMDAITVSGADMVGGCKPGGLAVDAQEQKQKERVAGEDSPGDIEIENVPREPLAIAALGLALVVAGLSWVRTRGATIGALALSIACIGALAGLYIKVGGDIDKEVAAKTKVPETEGGRMAQDMMKDMKIEAGSRYGLWITVAGLLGVAVLSGRALKETDPPHMPPARAIPPA